VFRRQIAFPVDVDHLWELLTDPSSVASWFGSTVEWELVPGGDIRFADGEDGVRIGRVESVDPPHELRFQWWPEDRGAEISEVTYNLASIEDGTQLTITEDPLRSQRVPTVDALVQSASAVSPEDSANASALDVAGRDEPSWSPWDSRLAGVWCIASMPTLLVTA
jgi:uncharacterized protein YndB with AHSA1/START domain